MWYDTEATIAAVLEMLRLQGGDIDEVRIADLVPVAAARIEAHIDGPVPDPVDSPLYQEALQLLTVDWYLHPQSGTDQFGVPYDDPVRAVRGILVPVKQRFGVG